jgi:hypothetical protein
MLCCLQKAVQYLSAMSGTPTAAHWLIRAEDTRFEAEQMHDSEAKRMMLGIAAGYEKLARHAALLASKKFPTEESETSPE